MRHLAQAKPEPASADTPRASARDTLRRVIPFVWPKDQAWVRRRVSAALVVLLLAKFISVSVPWFFKGAVDGLAGELPADHGLSALGLGAIGLTLAYGAARLLTAGFTELRDVIFVKVGQRALRELARQSFSHIHRLSLRYHITRRTGGLSRIIERGVKGVDFLLRFLIFSIGPLILELLLVSIIFAVLFGFAYVATVVIVVAVYVLWTLRVTEWRVALRRKMNDLDTEANQKAVDSLLNYETVKYFGAEAREASRYDAAMAGYEKAAVQTGQSLSMLNFGQAVIITLGLIIVMVLAAMGVQKGELTVGDFVMVNAYMIQITMPLGFLGTVYREIRQALVDMGEMFGLLNQPAEITDKAEAPTLAVKGGAIRFEDVKFGYDASRPILKGVSFEVPAGRTLALVGPSGSGKSTIGRLLFRFYDVREGAVKIDGQDLRDITQHSLHQAIGVVPQDTVLFNDTVLYNIAYGRAGASREEIEAAAKAAKIHDFIISLPEGYETKVGERGLKLSGGEKQRVGIARTILKNPPILLLDEATSALDTQTERDIQDSLREMGQGRTVISIAHRLSTIADADEILVLDAGQIVERGRHDELLAKGGRYAAMWARQASDMQTGA
ncbi:ABCB family ABC transporter ATP-binding protein/permease [Falsigemmobacter faecalis]|uniref:ABC transporter ATP-binding protein/permease n=1 Tax=Falsigemmobacter faecalis TaxID=2488730 RepID=A0A3P3DTU9_9RHOB|nr:ABC transporter ATP-binding protein/permease [Falsigemmobacter faecalis]RRH76892.1 ABC transporter ATP-binding protein/permease [Falsigemmobacter faecalis]